METPTNTVRPRSVLRLGLSRNFRGTLLTPSTCSTPTSNKKNDLPKITERTDTTNTTSTIDIGDKKQNDNPSSQPHNSENNSALINSIETSTNIVRLRPLRQRFFSRASLTPSTCSTPNSDTKNDLPKITEKTGYTNTSAVSTIEIGDQKQNDTPSSQPNNSENNNASINSLETPTSSRIHQMRYKLSLSKTTSASQSRKRMQYLKSESLIHPKRLKLDERELPNTSILEIENQISDNSVITSDAQPEDENSLTEAIAGLKSKIANIKKYEQRSSELSGLIPKWREAGEKTIEELKLKIQPKQDVKAILHHFNIDPTLFNVDEE